jgi:formate hydrogenlyase subunit 6/NADH:ubiquinone oxidoreductase subunit I
MSAPSSTVGARFLDRAHLQLLLDALLAGGYRVIGPTVSQDAIVYDEIRSVDELPRGWTDVQEPGKYRLEPCGDEALFGYVVGPHSWKKYLFPPFATVAVADRTETGWRMTTPAEPPARYAFVGVRACELAALRVQDRVFLEGPYVDPIYKARREQSFIIAVNCTQAASTCFCTSMHTGPRCQTGFDLALTELPAGFIVEIGTSAGEAVLALLPVREPTAQELNAAETARGRAVHQITRQMDTTDIRDLLLGNLNHPRWDEVAARCLSCANCTMVCPTCFCSSVNEVTDLDASHVERRRTWDSCFNIDFSDMNGGAVRDSVRSRYRQWLTHKLASWFDQFGSSGCVGCGRCITWCPVGIDLTEEVAAIRGHEA